MPAADSTASLICGSIAAGIDESISTATCCLLIAPGAILVRVTVLLTAKFWSSVSRL